MTRVDKTKDKDGKEKYKRGSKSSSWKFCLECDRLVKMSKECEFCYPAEYPKYYPECEE